MLNTEGNSSPAAMESMIGRSRILVVLRLKDKVSPGVQGDWVEEGYSQ